VNLEPDARFYRRRATEELAAAQRAVTPEARDRRLQLARSFISRLRPDEADHMMFEWGLDPKVTDIRSRRKRQSTYA
jgi:hypothetical protein